ncbi:protein kinase family protein [Bacillus sp. V3B]|uniref:protein kinase family protein n=1 Tax=Bacillus sp. V3B TaxID=2804915 RepID=UPI00210CFD62|nr:protein kinase family protein [Bacillus sp. V3B]MCQ6275635.1 protein kinase family protein [Bacillus sp. V3B]
MTSYNELAHSVTFARRGEKTILTSKHESLEFVGAGRSAFVFKIKSTKKVMKVFFPPFIAVAKEEAQIYQKLQGIEYFPTLYEAGENYLVIDYLCGLTFFECLSKGLVISPRYIEEVDQALLLARHRGLNPSDIHLRNIFLTGDGVIKVVDVARYGQKKECMQWRDLKRAFYRLYNKGFCPKKMPVWLLNLIAALYKKRWFSRLNVTTNKNI